MPLLQQRGQRGILDACMHLIVRNPVRLLAIGAGASLLLHLAASVLELPFLRIEQRPDSVCAFLKRPFLYSSVFAVVSGTLIAPLVYGAVVHAVAEDVLGRKMGIGRAYRAAGRRAVALIGATLLVTAALVSIVSLTWLCVALMPVGGSKLRHPVVWALSLSGGLAFLYVAVRWAFVYQAALVENTGPAGALFRSADLVSGNTGRALGMMLALWGIGVVITVVIGAFPGVPRALPNALSSLVYAVGMTLFYFDLRVRQERYTLHDLETELYTEAKGRDIRLPVQRQAV